ncbi:MAG: 2-oxoacid:acceptor oxidoreductase family protein [Candidatus Omnitrophica bacterium]|nr:2-oxoacid:acceptor oxidoreductase family protein [Candidatus Omnitrophota bacterium]
MDRKRSNKNIPFGQSEIKILIAGSGGQGILLLGKILSQSLLRENRNVSWLPSYGAEVRGGTCKCMVVTSESDISSPYIYHPDFILAMNEPSYRRYAPAIAKEGLIFYNSSLIGSSILNKNVENISIDATNIAKDLGDLKCANMVMLGRFIRHTSLASKDTVEKVLSESVKAESVLKLDIAALKRGFENA